MKNIETGKINKHGQVSIPSVVRKALHLNPGDNVGFEIQEDGNVVLRPVVFVDRRDTWFYTEEIGEVIQRAEQEIKEGKAQEFKDAKKALAWLKK